MLTLSALNRQANRAVAVSPRVFVMPFQREASLIYP